MPFLAMNPMMISITRSPRNLVRRWRYCDDHAGGRELAVGDFACGWLVDLKAVIIVRCNVIMIDFQGPVVRSRHDQDRRR